MRPNYHDILTLAHTGSTMGGEALVAYFLETYSHDSANLHLRTALEGADKITAAAASIRAALEAPTPEGEPILEPEAEEMPF